MRSPAGALALSRLGIKNPGNAVKLGFKGVSALTFEHE